MGKTKLNFLVRTILDVVDYYILKSRLKIRHPNALSVSCLQLYYPK